jgi:carbon monoxide dehydrogenase subunit G
MPVVTGSIDIQAPRDKVFDFIATPDKATTFVPGLNRISQVGPAQPEVGRTWEYEFNWFGVVVAGQSACTQCQRPDAYQFQTQTGAKSTWTYRFDALGDGTRLTLSVEFEEPSNLLARYAAQGTLKKMNEDRGREALANIKALLE